MAGSGKKKGHGDPPAALFWHSSTLQLGVFGHESGQLWGSGTPGERAGDDPTVCQRPVMWLWVALAFLVAVATLVAAVPIRDLPFSPFTDEFTVLQALLAYGRAELRKRRAATATELKVMLLGLDGSGKSSLLEYWLRGEAVERPPPPTTGFNIQELSEPPPHAWAWRGGIKLNIWELGGAKAIRPYWSRYFDDSRSGPARTVVFVVDGADTARFAEAEATLRATLAAGALPPQTTAALLCFTKLDVVLGSAESARAALQGEQLRQALSEWQQLQATERRVDVIMASTKVILPPAPGVSNEGRSSELLGLVPPFLGPGFRLGARWNRLVETGKTRKNRETNGGEMGEIRSKKCEGG